MITTMNNEESQSQNSPTFTRFLEFELFTEYSDFTDLIPESSGTGGELKLSSQQPPLSEAKYLIISNDMVTQARVENILMVLLQIMLILIL
jgi:hypothetical protein